MVWFWMCFEGKPIRYSDGLGWDVAEEVRRGEQRGDEGVMADSKVSGQNNWKDGLSSAEMGKAVSIKTSGGKIRNSVFNVINLIFFTKYPSGIVEQEVGYKNLKTREEIWD